jgi:hypothetical protein
MTAAYALRSHFPINRLRTMVPSFATCRRPDMRADKHLPELFPNIAAMRSYLRWRKACPEALAAVPRAWRRYQSWLDRHPWGPE